MPYNVLSPVGAGAIVVGTTGQPITRPTDNLATMSAELGLTLGSRGDVTPIRLRGWINWAYVNLARSLKLPELVATAQINTTSGQYQYAVPTVLATTIGASIVRGANWDGGRSLNKIDISGYRSRPEHSGVPDSYLKSHGVIALHPTPETAYSVFVDYRIRPLPMIADDHAPILAVEWVEAIVLNARRRAFAALLEFDKAAVANNEYVDLIRGLRDEAADEDEYRLVGSSVPRTRRQVRRKMRGRDYDAL
jgi:hypothetical protein